MNSGNAWFLCYHMYSVSKRYSPVAVEHFKRDVKFAVEKLNVEYVIVEDYFDNLVWGEYGNVWSKETLNAFIKATHDAGAKFLPYTNATELSTTGVQYPKNGRKWGAKTRWGKIYAGYASIFYPSVYSMPEYDWFGKIMCGASGWKNFLLKQIDILHDQFDIDGIYLDRVDYRVPCYDHRDNPEHFNEMLPIIVKEMNKITKSYDSKNFFIVNDSCMNPDQYTKQIFNTVDGILSELLFADMNPYSIEQKLAVRLVDFTWPFKKIVRPILTYLLPFIYHTPIMTNKSRMRAIISRIREAGGNKPLWLFSHRTDKTSLEFLRKNADENSRICYYTPWQPLRNVKFYNT